MNFTAASSVPAPVTFKTLEDELAYYKAQYEHLATELQEFQDTSRELEAELERDAEASEKREKGLRGKIEALNDEVDEWKTKCKQSKAEANAAHSSLQKEITSLRDMNRTVQLKLRDVEVANDDYERQARNTSTSLEDFASKYETALERSVLLEEEIRHGEQEREVLRIEAQRLRDALSDLKIETDIAKEKLQAAVISNALNPNPHRRRSPMSEKSLMSASTFTAFTPPAPISATSIVASDTHTSPSPSRSETSATATAPVDIPTKLAGPPHTRDEGRTPRPSQYGLERIQQSGQASTGLHFHAAPPFSRHHPGRTVRSASTPRQSLPRSGSLYQIRGLMGKMQKLEERVQSVKLKLPAPPSTAPEISLQGGIDEAEYISSTVTVRRSSKRPSEIMGVSTTMSGEADNGIGMIRPSRLSFSGQSASKTSQSHIQAGRVSNDVGARFAMPNKPAVVSAGSTNQSLIVTSSRPGLSLEGSFAATNGLKQSHDGDLIDFRDV